MPVTLPDTTNGGPTLPPLAFNAAPRGAMYPGYGSRSGRQFLAVPKAGV
ncbi:MAG: hypothetical protein R3F24_07000 [Gammaproteobacteria bacterium]